MKLKIFSKIKCCLSFNECFDLKTQKSKYLVSDFEKKQMNLTSEIIVHCQKMYNQTISFAYEKIREICFNYERMGCILAVRKGKDCLREFPRHGKGPCENIPSIGSGKPIGGEEK